MMVAHPFIAAANVPITAAPLQDYIIKESSSLSSSSSLCISPEEICTKYESFNPYCCKKTMPQPSKRISKGDISISSPSTMRHPQRRQVRFSTIHVRTFEVQYALDRPEKPCPLSLGWTIFSDKTYSVDDGDTTTTSATDQPSLVRPTIPPTRTNTKRLQRLSTESRKNRLRAMGYSEADIRKSETRHRLHRAMVWAYSDQPSDPAIPVPREIDLDRLLG